MHHELVDGITIELTFVYDHNSRLWSATWSYNGQTHTLCSGLSTCHDAMTQAFDKVRGKTLEGLL